MMDALLFGMNTTDAALFILRLALGGFFVLARFRFFYDPARSPAFCNPQRQESLTAKMRHCGWCRMPYMWACIVALIEVLGGLFVMLGFFTVFAAGALLALTVGATICTARDKVMEQNPVDALDCVACYLWRVEGLYIALALVLVLTGPGAISLDYWLFR